MPLINTPFVPGAHLQTIEAMQEGAQRVIAQAEYFHFSGQPDRALAAAAPYLDSQDVTACLSACLICAYSNLHLGQTRKAKALLDQMNAILLKIGERSPQLGAASAFVSVTAAVLLHLPLPQKLPDTDELLSLLPQGFWAACWNRSSSQSSQKTSSASSTSPTVFLLDGDAYTTPPRATKWQTTSPQPSSPRPCWQREAGRTRRSPTI